MTRHLFVPSSARESAPTVRQWCRIPASFRAPLRVCDLRYCYSIAAPRNPMWFVWGGRNETCAKGGDTVREAPNENVWVYAQLQSHPPICPARDQRMTGLHQVSTC
jgi:hypothetical protein